MKNDDITNTTQTHNMIMKHVDDHVDQPTELFTDLFVSLTGKNSTTLDAGGASIQTLYTFANTLCHFFKSKHNDFVV